MGFAPHTVTFLSRAVWIVALLTLAAWVIDCGVIFYSNSTGGKPVELIGQLFPPLPLYALPGVILLMCAKSVERGKHMAAGIIFIISILSLFKLVLLVSPLQGPYFDVPLYLELPVRISAALLSVACAYSWSDLADMKRTRNVPSPRNYDPRPARQNLFRQELRQRRPRNFPAPARNAMIPPLRKHPGSEYLSIPPHSA